MIKMELRVLRYFLSVAREGSMTGAAAALNITQPTLSRQIKDLETELGRQLFIRSSHSMSLTADGMALRRRAEEIIDMVNMAKTELSSKNENIAGDIYIGGGETDGMSLIADVISRLQKKFPAIRCHLYSGNAEDVTERLDKGLLDFGILIEPTNLSKYDYLTLPAKDIWGLLMPKDHPLTRKDFITAADLAGLPLICSRQILQNNTAGNDIFRKFGTDINKLNIVATYNLIFNAALLVSRGVGCALTLDKLVKDDNFCFKPLYPQVCSGLNIVWKKSRTFSTPAEFFLEMLQKKLKKTV